MKSTARLWPAFALLLAACSLPTPAPTFTAPPPATTTAPPTETATLAPPTATVEPTATLAPTDTPAPAGPQFLAYVREGELLVTDVSGGVAGGTTQYTQIGVDDLVIDLAWSPSGEFLAYVALALGEPHLFVVYAVGAGTPVDFGPGYNPVWSPDSTQIAYEQAGNLWLTPSDAPAPRQLTAQENWAWGRSAFTPDGRALLVTETSRDFMGAQGNTAFLLKQLALDGSGTLTALPAAESFDGGRLPYDLAYSPAGDLIAFTTSYHVNACASGGGLYVQTASGADRRELVSPTLNALTVGAPETYYLAVDYAWSPAGDTVAMSALVRDCADLNAVPAPTAQLSVLDLAGGERLVIPGLFLAPSYDRTGRLIAAAYYPDQLSASGRLHVYSAEDGHLVLDLGAGNAPHFQP